MELTDLEKGYVAGIIDGEGTITLTYVHSSNKFRAPSIEVTSTTLEMLEKMKALAGGTISKVSKRAEHHKQAYRWCIRYNAVIDLLKEISEYLLEPKKKYRADLILSTYKEVTPRNGKYSKEKLKAKLQFEEDFFKEI